MGKLLNCSSRFMMMLMVLVFWFASAFLMFLGIMMFKLIGSVSGAIDSKFLSVPAVGLVFLSLICLVIGIIGCAGASFENRKTQGVFFCLLITIVAIQLIGFILCIVYKHELAASIQDSLMNQVKHQYGNDSAITHSIDSLQERLGCCGVNSSMDWADSDWEMSEAENHDKVPGSCCIPTKCDTKEPVLQSSSNHYKIGCHTKAMNMVKPWLAWLLAAAIIFLLFELLALSCTCVRIRHSKKVKYQTLSEDNPSHGYRA